jgi:hypothetical protein
MPFKPDTAATPRFRPDTPETPSEIPQRRLPSISMAGDRATGFREQVEETGMTPEERQAAVAGTIPIAASLAAGPALGGLIRGIDALAASAAGLRGGVPFVREFGRSVQSGGLAPGLSIPQRILGAGTAGAASTAVINPEEIVTGATISALTPGVAKVGRALMPGVAPATKELTKAADKEYNAMRALNESLSPASFNTLQTSLINAANSAQYLPSKHTRLANAFQIFKEQAKLNQPVSIDRVDKLRKELAKAGNSPDKEERDLAQALVAQLDAFVTNAAPASAARLTAGRDLVTRKSRTKVIDDIMDKAANAKSGDKASVIQNEFRKISAGASKSDAAKKRQFTNDEQAIIADIGEGRLDINALRGAGNLLAPTTLNRNLMLNLPGYGFLASQLGPTVGAGTAVAGYLSGLGSRALANRLAMMRADQLRATAATGGAAAQRFAPTVFPQFAPVAATNAMAPEEVDFMREQERINALGF